MKAALGTIQSGGKFSFYPPSTNEYKKTIRASLSAGVDTFESAYVYENAETMLASVLREQRVERERITLIDKVMPAPSLKEKAETSLKRLKSDYIDYLLLHWPTGDEKLLFSSLRTLEKLKNEEKCHQIGVSNFPLNLLEKLSYDFELSALERPLSLLWTKELEETLRFCKAKEIKLLGYGPLGFGLLSGKYKSREELKDGRANLPVWNDTNFYPLLQALSAISLKKHAMPAQIAFSWALSKPVDHIIFGSRSVSQLEMLLSSPELTKEELSNLDEISSKLEMPGDNPYGHRWRE